MTRWIIAVAAKAGVPAGGVRWPAAGGGFHQATEAGDPTAIVLMRPAIIERIGAAALPLDGFIS